MMATRQPPFRLELGAIVVRRHATADGPALARHADDRRVADHLRDAFPHPYTVSDAESYILRLEANPAPTSLLITVDGDPCGGIGYVPGTDVERVGAEVGYWLGAEYWGRGIMSHVLSAFSAEVFRRHAEFERLFALPFAGNAASARVLEKAGYVREGTLRRAVIKNGTVLDQHVYALLRRARRSTGARRPRGG